jgi:hypothetical protein
MSRGEEMGGRNLSRQLRLRSGRIQGERRGGAKRIRSERVRSAHILAGLVCCKEVLELVRLPSRRNKNEDETLGQTRLPVGKEETAEAD